MSTNTISMARSHILGEISGRCEPVQSVPVYLNDKYGEILGYADESLGKYADAITFHLDEGFGKKLTMGHFTYSFDFDYINADPAQVSPQKRRIRLNSILLVERKGYARPESKRKAGDTEVKGA